MQRAVTIIIIYFLVHRIEVENLLILSSSQVLLKSNKVSLAQPRTKRAQN